MNAQEVLQIIQALKEAGGSYLSLPGLELRLNPGAPLMPIEAPTVAPRPSTHSQPSLKSPEAPIEPPSPLNEDATKRVEDVIDLLKMKDEELVDKIFPV